MDVLLVREEESLPGGIDPKKHLLTVLANDELSRKPVLAQQTLDNRTSNDLL